MSMLGPLADTSVDQTDLVEKTQRTLNTIQRNINNRCTFAQTSTRLGRYHVWDIQGTIDNTVRNAIGVDLPQAEIIQTDDGNLLCIARRQRHSPATKARRPDVHPVRAVAEFVSNVVVVLGLLYALSYVYV